MTWHVVIDFWFSDAAEQRWFRSTPQFDAEIRERFEATWISCRTGLCADWERSSAGALALVVVLDQFPLNMYRSQALSYSTEAQARAVAERAIAKGFDQQLNDTQKAFMYMPFMHSEDLADQERSVVLFEKNRLTKNLRYAKHHREVIRRFGRFPHRNNALNRPSTDAEKAWLSSPEGFNP